MTQPNVAYRGRIKYDEKTARAYQARKQRQHGAEMRLVDRAFALVPKTHRVLDVPCGGGRVSVHLGRAGYGMACADLSDAMITITRETVKEHGFDFTVEKQDVEHFTYADRGFDTILSFRLFHHFPNREIRARAVKEICRVARKYVVLSYFSPASVTSVKRKLRAALGGKPSQKHSTSLAEVEEHFRASGFRLVKDFAQTPIIHTLHVAVFERVGESKP